MAFEQASAVDLEFRPDPGVVRTARDATNVLGPAIPSGVLDDVRLLTSELVTNSVRHAGMVGDEGWVRLKLAVEDDTVHVEVRDPGPGFDASPRSAGLAESGWGMFLLDQIADRWGVENGEETCVWFEIGTRAA